MIDLTPNALTNKQFDEVEFIAVFNDTFEVLLKEKHTNKFM